MSSVGCNGSSLTGTFCYSECQNIALMYWNTRLILVFVFISIGICAAILNPLVAWVISKTKQCSNQSIKLIMYLSVIDSTVAITLTSSIVIPLLKVESLSCNVYKALYFLRHISFYSSCYIVCLIGIDRYCRVQFKEDYDRRFDKKRFRAAIFVYFCLVLWQSILACALNTVQPPHILSR